MSEQQSQITPPPDLVTRLRYEAPTGELAPRELHLITAAYRAGADDELEACCADIHTVYGKRQADWLRSMRRPEPPSLAKRALHILGTHGDLSCAEHDTIRQALEILPND